MANKSRKPPKQNDELLKGAFEENFPDFLRFLYSDADEIKINNLLAELRRNDRIVNEGTFKMPKWVLIK